MSENSNNLSDGDRREGAAPGAGKRPARGRKLPSIFDGLPPGPLDLAALHEAMERDLAARALACLDRVAARRAAGRHSHTSGHGGCGAAPPATGGLPESG